MLRPKFLVPAGFRGAWRNYLRPVSGEQQARGNASRCERLCPSASKKAAACPRSCPRQPSEVCPRPRYTVNPFGRGRTSAERHCPTPKLVAPTANKSDCNVPAALHPNYSCSNSPPHAAEVFRRAFAEVRDEALDTQIFARVAANNLIEPMVDRNRLRVAEEAELLDKLLGNLRQKIDDLLARSLVCGSREQAKFYRMSEKMHAELQSWSCENASSENCVKCRLQQLECTVKERTDMAVDIVRTCNRSVTPESLLLCVNLTKKDAKCILDRTNEMIKREISAVEGLKADFSREAEKALGELKKQREREINKFSSHLTVCIDELKKYTKKNQCR